MFSFKHFTINQEYSAMKVSTDACAFGAWLPALLDATVLDIGTGTGLLALMLAQKCQNSKIDAIELDAGAFSDASLNFQNSDYSDHINLINADIKEFQNNKTYDVIICNPPFYEEHLKSASLNKNLAHHTTALRYSELWVAIKRFSKSSTSVYLLINEGNFKKIQTEALKNEFYIEMVMNLKHNVNKPIIRNFIKFTQLKTSDIKYDTLIIHEGKEYSERFKTLLSDYYIIF